MTEISHPTVLREPIDGPTVWRSGDLERDPTWRYRLAEDEIGDLEHALAHCRATGKPTTALERDDFPLSVLAPRIASWMLALERGRGFQNVCGLPIDRWSAEDRERIARFQREAKLLASVNHPSIAAVYDFNSVDDLRFLVMEYVEGETLADRLERGPLQIDQLELQDRAGAPVAKIAELELEFADVQPLIGRWHFTRLRLAKPEVDVVVLKEGGLNLMDLLPPPGKAAAAAAGP